MDTATIIHKGDQHYFDRITSKHSIRLSDRVTEYTPASETITLVLFLQYAVATENDFKPGHVIDIAITGTDPRPYSVASYEGCTYNGIGGTIVTLYIRNIDGQLTRPLARDLYTLNTVFVANMYRLFEVDEKASIDRASTYDKNLKLVPIFHKVLFATGTGIAPFLSYLQSALPVGEASGEHGLEIVFSVKSAAEFNEANGYVQHLYELLEAHKMRGRSIQTHILITRPEKQDLALLPDVRDLSIQLYESPGRGTYYIQDVARDIIFREKQMKVYACGVGDMLRDVGALVINEWQNPAHMFAYEAFTC